MPLPIDLSTIVVGSAREKYPGCENVKIVFLSDSTEFAETGESLTGVSSICIAGSDSSAFDLSLNSINGLETALVGLEESVDTESLNNFDFSIGSARNRSAASVSNRSCSSRNCSSFAAASRCAVAAS